MSADATRHVLSSDGMTLVIKRRAPGGILTTTLQRQPGAGPFTEEDVTAALRLNPDGKEWLLGQRNRIRRYETRFGILWVHLMSGPPIWWLPKLRRERDGTVMAGWLRLAAAVRFDRMSTGPAQPGESPGASGSNRPGTVQERKGTQ
jgi:hypothetical protein